MVVRIIVSVYFTGRNKVFLYKKQYVSQCETLCTSNLNDNKLTIYDVKQKSLYNIIIYKLLNIRKFHYI